MNSFTTSVLMHSAAVGVIACLISESEVAAPLRDRFKWRVLLCPVCLGFWLATPALGHGPLYYLLVVGASNAWMLVILKVYESLESS